MPYIDMSHQSIFEWLANIERRTDFEPVHKPASTSLSGLNRTRHKRTWSSLDYYPTPTPDPPLKRCRTVKGYRKAHTMSTGSNPYDVDKTPRPPRTFTTTDAFNVSRPSSSASSDSVALSDYSTVSRGSKRLQNSLLGGCPTKRALLLTIPKSIKICAYDDSVVPGCAPLDFKNLVNKVLDFAEGLQTVPESLKVGGICKNKLRQLHPAKRITCLG